MIENYRTWIATKFVNLKYLQSGIFFIICFIWEIIVISNVSIFFYSQYLFIYIYNNKYIYIYLYIYYISSYVYLFIIKLRIFMHL